MLQVLTVARLPCSGTGEDGEEVRYARGGKGGGGIPGGGGGGEK